MAFEVSVQAGNTRGYYTVAWGTMGVHMVCDADMVICASLPAVGCSL